MESDHNPEEDLLTIGEALRLVGGAFAVSRSSLYEMGVAQYLRAHGRHTAIVRAARGGRRPGRFRVPAAVVAELIRRMATEPPFPPPLYEGPRE